LNFTLIAAGVGGLRLGGLGLLGLGILRLVAAASIRVRAPLRLALLDAL
jgi:hypothetical protein